MKRVLVRGILGFLAVSAILYLADMLVLVTRSNRYGQVSVDFYIAVPLKNGKTELDYDSTRPVSCVHSLFPQLGQTPCWYLQHHAEHVEKI